VCEGRFATEACFPPPAGLRSSSAVPSTGIESDLNLDLSLVASTEGSCPLARRPTLPHWHSQSIYQDHPVESFLPRYKTVPARRLFVPPSSAVPATQSSPNDATKLSTTIVARLGDTNADNPSLPIERVLWRPVVGCRARRCLGRRWSVDGWTFSRPEEGERKDADYGT
jgi:hypothetical protein